MSEFKSKIVSKLAHTDFLAGISMQKGRIHSNF